mgnify:CR=1 FL=1
MINLFGWIFFGAFLAALFYDTRAKPDFIVFLVLAVICLSIDF